MWKEHLGGCAGQKDLKVLEIGSFDGRSAVWILENLLTHPTSHLTCIDTFTQEERHDDVDIEALFDHNISVTGVQERVTKLRGSSATILRSLPFDEFDIVHISDSQTARRVLSNAVLSWELLKRHGILILNDYGNDSTSEDIVNGPHKGIDAFMHCYDGEYVVVHMALQVMLRKTKNIREIIRSVSGRDT